MFNYTCPCRCGIHRKCSSQEPITVNVEFRDGHKTVPGTLPCLLPHDILKFLMHDCGLNIPDQLCRNYWQHLDDVNDEVAVSSRQLRRLADQEVWPIGIHGDEANIGLVNAPFDKILGVFMNVPLFRPRSTLVSRYLLFSVEHSRIVDVHRTINPVLTEIVASLNRCLETGILGRRFIVTELRGDQVWIKFLFQHRSSWQGVPVCFRCQASTRATDVNYLFYDKWLPTLRSTMDFLVEELPDQMRHLGKP